MRETIDEYKDRLDKMIQAGKLKVDYKDILLEINELAKQAIAFGLIFGHGWREDSNCFILDEYEILDKEGNILYLNLSEACDYLNKIIVEYTNII